MIYVSGPMAGYPQWNFPAFKEATARLRAAVPVVFMPGQSTTVTQTFTPQPIVNTVTKTAEAPAPVVETVEKTAQAAAETVTRTIEVPATQKQRETKTETVTETATETERVLQVVDNDKGKSGERGN